MTTKKSTTKAQGGKGSRPQQTPACAEPASALAGHLSEILNNPTCPARIYNAIAEELCDMSSDIDYHTPEMIARSIAAYDRREAKRQQGDAQG
jgi:hypothetical protein